MHIGSFSVWIAIELLLVLAWFVLAESLPAAAGLALKLAALGLPLLLLVWYTAAGLVQAVGQSLSARVLAQWGVFLVAIVLLCGGYVYVGYRLLEPVPLASIWKIVAPCLPLLVLLPGPLIEATGLSPTRTAVRDLLQAVSFVAIGFFVLLLTLVIAVDLAWVAGRVLDGLLTLSVGVHLTESLWAGEAADGRYNAFVQGVNLAIVAGAGALTAIGFRAAIRLAEVRQVTVRIPGLPPALKGFRIVQLSDVHLGPVVKGERLARIVRKVNRLDADVIAITGDLIDGPLEELRDQVAPIRRLRSRYGTYFVTGNHEYMWEAERWLEELRSLGVIPLLNEHRLLRRGAGRLLLCGVNDITGETYLPAHRSDPQAALEGAPASDVKVLLAHQPRSVYAAAEAGYDLQLSGHTHGGQFFPWTYLTSFEQPFAAGLHAFGKLWIYVSRGAGTWGPPMRLGAPSEITVLRLKPARPRRAEA